VSKLQIVIFDVGAAQSILVYPPAQTSHARLIDCGGEEDGFSPVEFIVSKKLLPKNGNGIPKLGNLTITNYDHDHFSWLPDLRKKVDIWTTQLPKNISSKELKFYKDEVTEALEHLCYLKDTYTHPAQDFDPVYKTETYHLEQGDLEGDLNTNHLSQMVFIEFEGSKLCVAGDLEKPAWEKILLNQGVRNHLSTVDVLIAPHHGRENGYHEAIFKYCSPELIIISDKDIVHDTQSGMAQLYSKHVKGNGISFNGSRRKVLTTRSDGHILVEFEPNGKRTYDNLRIA
jgi:beta-lactamase superfamily II metal-dependent hydrolase